MGTKEHDNRDITISKLWLNYFNAILYEKGIIDEDKRNEMNRYISEWKGVPLRSVYFCKYLCKYDVIRTLQRLK